MGHKPTLDAGAKRPWGQMPQQEGRLASGRFADAPGAPGKSLDNLADLGRCHPFAFEAVERIGLVGGARALLVFDAADIALAARVAELPDELAVILVNPFAEFPPERYPVVPLDRGVIRKNAAAKLDRLERHRRFFTVRFRNRKGSKRMSSAIAAPPPGECCHQPMPSHSSGSRRQVRFPPSRFSG